MFGDARRVVVLGGIALFVVGFLIGVAVGRSGRDAAAIVVAPRATRTEAPRSPSRSVVAATPAVVTPSAAIQPAISTQNAVLREGDRPVVAAAVNAPCRALITPGRLGDCGDVTLASGRVVWVVEHATTSTGATAFDARVFTFVPSESGWVEWLQAADPTGERWTDVNVLSTDLTADGVPELVFGFRGTDDRSTLSVDVVGYGQDGLPAILAHPNDAPRGSVVASGGNLVEYVGQYPNGEPACCPSSYLANTIAFDDGFLRVVSSQTVAPNLVPTSQL